MLPSARAFENLFRGFSWWKTAFQKWIWRCILMPAAKDLSQWQTIRTPKVHVTCTYFSLRKGSARMEWNAHSFPWVEICILVICMVVITFDEKPSAFQMRTISLMSYTPEAFLNIIIASQIKSADVFLPESTFNNIGHLMFSSRWFQETLRTSCNLWWCNFELTFAACDRRRDKILRTLGNKMLRIHATFEVCWNQLQDLNRFHALRFVHSHAPYQFCWISSSGTKSWNLRVQWVSPLYGQLRFKLLPIC